MSLTSNIFKQKGEKQMGKNKGKFHLVPLILVLLLALEFSLMPITTVIGGDLPEGPVVQIGDPTITVLDKEMTVNAGAQDKTWIDWSGGFNIGVENTVNNLANSASSVILHNDVSGAISNIQGALNGNCNVFLLNPSGILFSPTAQINVGGLVASTLRMSMDDFVAGKFNFNDEGLTDISAIINSGIINAEGGMGVSLIGGAVKNEGIISANLGTVNLVAGGQVTLNINDEGSVQVAVGKGVLKDVRDSNGFEVEIGVNNLGQINADGGKVFIQAEAMEGVFDKLINQAGTVKAGSMVERNGKIILLSESEGIVQNTGTLDVSAIEANAKGGTVEMTGSKVGQFGTVKADAINGDGGIMPAMSWL
jgi:filamentous hemagglutinin family protein